MARELNYSPDLVPWHRRRRVRQWLLAILVIMLLVPATAFALVTYHFHRMRRNVADMGIRYRQIQRGMTLAEARAVMGGNGTALAAPQCPAVWDRETLSDEEAARIRGGTYYAAPNLVLPSEFVITFDGDGRVVGKWCDL